MAKRKYNYAVLLVDSGSFVSKVTSDKTAYWKAGEEAKFFSKEIARDIAFGLTFNGSTAVVVEVPSYIYVLRNKGENDG